MSMRELTATEIHFAVPDKSKFFGLITDSGFEVTALKTQNGGNLPEAYAAELEAFLSARNFDLIVQDLNPIQWTATVAWPSIPRAVITNIFLAQKTPFQTVQSVQFENRKHAINAIRMRKDLPVLETYVELYRADLVCFTDPKPIVDLFGLHNENDRACGACFWQIPAQIPDELTGLSNFILASMGSTGRARFDSEFLTKLVHFSSNNQLVYVGPAPPITDGTGMNCQAFDQLPLNTILPKVSLAITQGGSGSTYQALSHGVPIIVVPSHRNQAILGEILEQLGVGICLSDDSSLEKLDAFNLETLISNARQFSEQLNLQNGPITTACHLLKMLE